MNGRKWASFPDHFQEKIQTDFVSNKGVGFSAYPYRRKYMVFDLRKTILEDRRSEAWT